MVQTEDLTRIWSELKDQAESDSSLVIRSTGIPGVSIAYDPSSASNKILIRVEEAWGEQMFPKWSGLTFSSQDFEVPISRPHLVLDLVDEELRDIFALFCKDLMDNLGDVTGEERDGRIQETVNSWDQFFRAMRDKKLSREKQQGLFAELKFLLNLISSDKISNHNAVESWKGGERAHHDFQFKNRVVEVKSTTSKEPKKVKISNEKQLNDTDLDCLMLSAYSLLNVSGGETLGDLVSEIQDKLSSEQIVRDRFVIKLLKYGLHLDDIPKYPAGYSVEKEQFYTVVDGFPRIINFDDGVGDVKYSVTINSCSSFEIDAESALEVYTNG